MKEVMGPKTLFRSYGEKRTSFHCYFCGKDFNDINEWTNHPHTKEEKIESTKEEN